jgi:single-stranded-DNA-specific exonuclease
MTLRNSRWMRPGPLPEGQVERLRPESRFLVQLLYNRGITEPAAVRAFLDHRPPHSDDPFQFQHMEAAVARIRRAIQEGESIAVYGDFDADGVTASVLLVEALRAMGARLVVPYIPSRIAEGYGLNEEALGRLADGTHILDDDLPDDQDKGRHSLATEPLDQLARRQISLVITVDCGIRAVDQIVHANRLGLDVIVTDHHSVRAELPPAVAIINPKRPGETYPDRDLAGVGVAFKLVQALVHSGLEPAGLGEDDLLDLVALGTVADLAPMLGENRSLVYRGLQVINERRRPGIAALLESSGLRQGQATASTIGFGLGPRINAAGRMADAYAAARLLITGDADEAASLARELSALNRERQEQTRVKTELAEERALASDKNAFLLFAADPEFPQGIVGLIASRLSEKFYRPAVVAQIHDDQAVGSCRSIAEFHITEALDQCRELLVKHGGHAAAAGFTVKVEDLPELQKRLGAIAQAELTGKTLIPTLAIDEELELSATLFPSVQTQLAQLEPCGYGNPSPLLYSGNVRVANARTVGHDGAHLKLTFVDGNHYFDAIAFRMGDARDQVEGRFMDIVYYLEENEWNGQRRMQLNIQDMRPVGEE